MARERGLRIKVFPSLCTGMRECHKWGPDVYLLDENGCCDFQVMEVPREFAQQARMGAALCPSHAVMIVDDPFREEA